MNAQEQELLLRIAEHPGMSQRALARACGMSLGLVNRLLKALAADGWLSASGGLSEAAAARLHENEPRRAVILAAGFGMRMVPINTSSPKGLLEVRGEPLIERLIRQLNDAGITEIHIVVGFMKESFEYLIDRYGVDLIVNRDYAGRNNLHSLRLAGKHLSGCFIVPSDLWCAEDPFPRQAVGSWYMVGEETDPDSTFRVTRGRGLAPCEAGGSRMLGISYIAPADAEKLEKCLLDMDTDANASCFWEDALAASGIALSARIMPKGSVEEINTYEQLRELDSSSGNLRSGAIRAIASAMKIPESEIRDITVLKKGMTNRSFLFTAKGAQYIMRIPGEGTENLISREREAAVYRAIDGLGLSDDILLMQPDTGYKISRFLPGARVCDPLDPSDVNRCMALLRRFHERGIKVGHVFDLFGQIAYYQSLWGGKPSAYRDHRETTEHVFALKPYVDAHALPHVLTHIDAVPDNFLFSPKEGGGEELHLIDWEYAGMQDPHVDIAMFIVYAMYDRPHAEALIDSYFPEGCSHAVRTKIYCYIAACGLLWSNWCEYKSQLGVEFGEYSLRQYRFAKDYYRVALAAIRQEEPSHGA